MKLTSILLLSLGLVSGVASAGGTTEAGVGGALGGVLGAVVGQQLGGSTGSAIGAGVGGAAGSAVGADKRSRGEAAIGGALGAAGGNVLGRGVDDHRFAGLPGGLQVQTERGLLQLGGFRLVVVIQAGFADGHHAWVIEFTQ